MDILYRDFGAAQYREIGERLSNPTGLSPHSQIFAPLDVLTDDVASRRYAATPENALSINWYVKLNVDSTRDKKAWESIKVPAGEVLSLYKHIPGYNRLLDVGILVGCGSAGLTADVEIVTYADPATAVHTIATAVDLSVCDEIVADPATLGDYIKRDDSYLVKVSITPPFTDADGNGVFVKDAGTPCEERACLNLLVHTHLRHMCFHDAIRGCRLDDSNCGCESSPAPATCE